MAKPSDPTKWLERAAHIRGLACGVRNARMMPMFERLAARLEEIGMAKAAAEMKAEGRGHEDLAAPAGKAPRRRGKSGGELNNSARSQEDEQEIPRRVQSQGHPRP